MSTDGHAGMHLKRDDRGVTLPEVLVAVTILAIIIVPLTDALIGFVRNTDATTRRMSESHDIQLASSYFARDVQNLGVRNWAAAGLTLQQSINNAAYPCVGPGTPVVSLAWDEPTTVTGPPTVLRATYLVRVVGAERQLRRLQCGGSSTLDIVVIHNMVGTPPDPVCANAAGTAVPCTGSGSGVPQRVTLTVSIRHPSSAAATTVTLTGQRRQS